MATQSMCQPQVGGFDFENCKRNAVLEADVTKLGCSLPAARKTGTTIAGIVFKDGIVLGADTWTTKGKIVADRECSKIHEISTYIYCCGAGTAADIVKTTQIISSNMELHALSTGREPRVATACHMLKQMLFRYQGRIEADLILGGVRLKERAQSMVLKGGAKQRLGLEHSDWLGDNKGGVDFTGPHLYGNYAHGSTDKLPYVTMGSGCMPAMAVFEDRYMADMKERDAIELVRDAIMAGIRNDPYSGGDILRIITRGRSLYDSHVRRYPWPHKSPIFFPGKDGIDYKYQRGTTGVLTEDVIKLDLEVVDETVQTMDTS